MPLSDDNPRAARRLREFGRRRVPDDVVDRGTPTPGGTTQPPGGSAPPPTTLTPGSIWGPSTPVEPIPTSRHEPPSPVEPASKHRRRAGERPADPDSVNIDADTSHDWWAKRDDLDQIVNPKKRGAAARAQRAAREAFAPAGTTNVSSTARRPGGTATTGEPTSTRGRWDPADVYSWGPATTTTETPSQADEWSTSGGGWHDDPFDTTSDPHVGVDGSTSSTPTPWDVMGLTSEATWAEVGRRHKQLAKHHHPDRHQGDGPDAKLLAEQRMSEINAAYSDLRRIYQLTDGT